MIVSVDWLFICIILCIIIYFVLKGFKVYEEFTTEGFTDVPIQLNGIRITTCPAKSKSFVDKKGLTMCCDGTIENNACSKAPICTLSTGSSVPTCSDWFASYLKSKSGLQCPKGMPNYFEKGSEKGCTFDKLLPNGSGPASRTAGFCKIYSGSDGNINRNILKSDSCLNEKLKESTVCTSSKNPYSWWDQKYIEDTKVTGYGLPVLIKCAVWTGKTVGHCHSDESLIRRYNEIAKRTGNRNWRDKLTPTEKLNFCSVYQKHAIDKTLEFKNIPSVSID